MIQQRLFQLRSLSLHKCANFISAERQAKILSYILPKDKPFLEHVIDYEKWLDPNVPFDESSFNSKELIKGYATEYATQKFAGRSIGKTSKTHFRLPYNSKLSISSIGIGTYMGAPDSDTDFAMYNAVKESVLSGAINFIDTGNLGFEVSHKLSIHEI